jgi:Helitron helicase-like domain at N-terminus
LQYIESEQGQKKIRSAPVKEVMAAQDDNERIGQRVKLPASFHGSPVSRAKSTQDALSIVVRRGKPHLILL